jgi:hypothetical protein
MNLDGIDWDMETGYPATWGTFNALLKDSLNAVGAQMGKPLTNSVWTYGNAQSAYTNGEWRYFDRIQIEAYEQTGAYQGWIVWNGYGIYSRGVTLPCYPYIPATGLDSSWTVWKRLGVPDSVLMISQAASGRIWQGGHMVANVFGKPVRGGATQQGDVWTGSYPPNCNNPYAGMPTVSGYEVSYRDIVTTYAAYPTEHDTLAISSSKSIDVADEANDKFITFADPWAFWKQYRYMVDVRNGGGMSVWAPISGRMSAGNFPIHDAIKMAKIGMPLPSAPTGTFTASPDTFAAGGGTTTLTWTSTNATTVTISPAIGAVAASGNRSVGVSSSMDFVLTVSNTNGEAAYRVHIGVAQSGGSGGLVVVDTFNRANNTSLGSGWAVPSGRVSCGIVNLYYTPGGQVCVPYNCGQANGTNGRGFNYRTETFGNDQYAEVIPKATLPGFRYVYAGVRMGGAMGEGYYAKTDGANTWLVKINNSGTETTLQTLTNVNFQEYGNDRMKIQVVGNVLKVFKNGVQVSLDLIDNSIASGHPGVSVTPDNNCSFDSFEGGGLLIGGQGHQDITIQALPPIALITQPTGGGSRNIEIIRDGFTPPVGSSDPTLQYDTYNGGGARAFDWIGYQFSTQHTFAGMIFQEGMQFSDGGWFTSLGVQVRVGGQWVDVQNLQSTPPYAGANGINYETYGLSFAPIAGDGIRIAGVPGGSSHYMSVAELRVFNSGTSGVTPDPTLPRDYALSQNYPNPFNPSTKIGFNLPVGNDVTIKVYNVLGQEIATLASGFYDAGRYSIDFSGDRLPNGIYFYAIKAGNYMDMKKMVLLK